MNIVKQVIPGAEIKYGAIYTKEFGIERSVAAEVLQLAYGISVDIGYTNTQLFAGLSKDLYSSKVFEIDIGAGVTDRKNIYAGIHIHF